jgi:hypothetical protein
MPFRDLTGRAPAEKAQGRPVPVDQENPSRKRRQVGNPASAAHLPIVAVSGETGGFDKRSRV